MVEVADGEGGDASERGDECYSDGQLHFRWEKVR